MSTQKRTKFLPWIAAVAVLGLVAIVALPVLAAPTGTKFYTATVTPGTVNTGTSPTFTVTVTNTSPKQSSSNISSVSILVPSQFTINGPPPISTATTNG